MNGVEILAIEQVAVSWKYNWGAFWAVFLILFGLMLIGGLIAFADERDLGVLVIFAIGGLALGAVIGAVVGGGASIAAGYVEEYKATVSEDVSLVEFNERYEIVEQEGKIYTVRERENNNG